MTSEKVSTHNQVSPSIEGLFLIVQFLPSEVLSFILDTESLSGIMENEHISFNDEMVYEMNHI